MAEVEAAIESKGGVIRVGASTRHTAAVQARAKARRAIRDWEAMWGPAEDAPSARAPATGGWSAAARRRMRRRFAETDWTAITEEGGAVLLTLTLPGAWLTIAPTPDEFARVLRRFWERWRRAYGDPRCGWVIEYQRRGAPHLHALIHRPAGRAWVGRGQRRRRVRWGTWVRHAWAESVAHPDPEQRRLHLRHGVDVQPWTGDPSRAGYYFSGYASGRWKGQNHPPAVWGGVGLLRVWGIRGLPTLPGVEVVLTESQRVWALRFLRRWWRANHGRKRYPGTSTGVTILTPRSGAVRAAIARAVENR
jgi:hypothetical protein